MDNSDYQLWRQFPFRNTSLFWIEKFWLIVDYLQIYTILWNISQPWPWPYLWLNWTKYLVLANLDWFSTTTDGALLGRTSAIDISKWGQMNGYLIYSIIQSIIPIAIIIITFIIFPFYSTYGKRWDIYRAPTLRISLFLLQLFYLPSSLVVFRLYYCNENMNLSADPNVKCNSLQYIVVVFFCTLFIIPYMVALPVMLYYYIKDLIVYNLNTDHEKRLQVWELSYMVHLDDFWDTSQMWLTSSFKRSAAYFRVTVLVYKAVILVIFLAFRFNFYIQSSLLWLATMVFVFYVAKDRPYRSKSSNAILYTLLVLLCINVSSALLNAFSVQNAATVSSTESIWLLIVHIIALFVILVVLVVSYFSPFDNWPVDRTLTRISQSKHKNKVKLWIDALHLAKLMVRHVATTAPEVMDYYGIERVLTTLRNCWLSAKSCGSIFELPLGETIEELLIIHSQYSSTALRKYECWDAAYLETGGEMSVRHRQRGLVPPGKRGMLLKLLALRSLMGDRKFAMSETTKAGAGAADSVSVSRRSVSFAESLTMTAASASASPNPRRSFPAIRNVPHIEDDASSPFVHDTCAEIRKEIQVMVQQSEALLHDSRTEHMVDMQMIQELHQLKIKWDDSLQQYEAGDLPASITVSDVEDWYIYQRAVTERLTQLQTTNEIYKEFENALPISIHLHAPSPEFHMDTISETDDDVLTSEKTHGNRTEHQIYSRVPSSIIHSEDDEGSEQSYNPILKDLAPSKHIFESRSRVRSEAKMIGESTSGMGVGEMYVRRASSTLIGQAASVADDDSLIDEDWWDAPLEHDLEAHEVDEESMIFS